MPSLPSRSLSSLWRPSYRDELPDARFGAEKRIDLCRQRRIDCDEFSRLSRVHAKPPRRRPLARSTCRQHDPRRVKKNRLTFVITVDGPAAAGKGTLTRALASGLGYERLDSGRLYRSVAKHAAEEAWQRLEEQFQNEAHVKGTIKDAVKGGFTVDLDGAEAFLRVAAGKTSRRTSPRRTSPRRTSHRHRSDRAGGTHASSLDARLPCDA